MKRLQARARSNNGSTMEVDRSSLFVRDHLFDRLKVFGTFTTTLTRQNRTSEGLETKHLTRRRLYFLRRKCHIFINS